MVEEKNAGRRKLRVLVISMGGERQAQIEQLFAEPLMESRFEPPVFSPGVSSRSLRNRSEFFRHAHTAGLLPLEEWKALSEASTNLEYKKHPDKFFECLDEIPITQGRRGDKWDVSMHYSLELWKKAKTVNRGRSVLACAFAHLVALKKLVEEDFDLLLEDNVRAPINHCADRMWHLLDASKELESERGQQCHMRYMGWLGSVPNLRWIYSSHIKRRRYCRESTNGNIETPTIFEFPSTQDIEADLAAKQKNTTDDNKHSNAEKEDEITKTEREPGGNPVWGTYAYWISKEGYDDVMKALRTDVGSLLWKSKKMRCYLVKPIDKIVPRRIIATFGQSSVQLPTHPTFFRAPMLTSKIHTQWDPEFCKSTEFQLGQTDLSWQDIWLTEMENKVVDHYSKTGAWLTPAELTGSAAESPIDNDE